MKDTKKEKLCPNCGRPMDFIKTVKKPIDKSEIIVSKEQEDKTDEGYSILEIYNCLNCSTTWEHEISNNVWRKVPLIKE